MNATQLQALEDAIFQRDQQISNIKQCETEYNNAVTTLNELHPDIAAESSPDGAVFTIILPQDCRSFAVEEWTEV